jgi:uncharacterized protein YndB with AHSA1/START domain
MNKPEFVYVSYIATTPETLWKALISAEFTRQYWAEGSIQSDWKVGSPVKLLKPDGGLDWKGEILQSDPPRVLSYTFDPQNYSQSKGLSEQPSRVIFEISPLESEPTSKRGVVRLQVTHDNFEAGSDVYRRVSQGWPAILSSLKSLLESGRSLEFVWKC